MINLTQLFLAQAVDAQSKSKESAKAQSTRTDAAFSLFVEKASGSTKNTQPSSVSQSRQAPRQNASDAAKRSDQKPGSADVDWASAAAAAAQTQPQPATGEAADSVKTETTIAAQDALSTATPDQASVDTLEGVELLNIIGDITGEETATDGGQALNTAGVADDTDVEYILTNMAGDDIEYVSGNKESPLENVSSQAAQAAAALKMITNSSTDEQPVGDAQAVADTVNTAHSVQSAAQSAQTQTDSDDASAQGGTASAQGNNETAAAPKDTAQANTQQFDLSAMAAQAQAAQTQQSARGEAVARLTQSVLSQATEGIDRALSDGQSRFSIQMKPDFLGRLAINLVMGEDGLTAQIRSSDPGVRGMLNAEITALTQSLKDKGIEVVNVEIMQHEMSDTASENYQSNDPRQSFDGSRPRGSRMLGGAPDIAGYGEDGAIYEGAAAGIIEPGATVEYEA